MVHSDTKTFEQAVMDAAEVQPLTPDEAAHEDAHDEHSGHNDGHPAAGSGHGGGHDDHGQGHEDNGHDDHGGGHGHHAPPAPKYLLAPPARMGDVNVRTWVAYGIFLLLIVVVAIVMLAAFGR